MIRKLAFLAWFKLALQTVERFSKSFSARFGKSRYKVSNKLMGFLNLAAFFILSVLASLPAVIMAGGLVQLLGPRGGFHDYLCLSPPH
jgi:hypothetical protein